MAIFFCSLSLSPLPVHRSALSVADAIADVRRLAEASYHAFDKDISAACHEVLHQAHLYYARVVFSVYIHYMCISTCVPVQCMYLHVQVCSSANCILLLL